MRRPLNQFAARLISAATVVLLFLLLWLISNPHYDLNDDVILLRSFAGLVGGEYEPLNAFTHTLLAWPLHWLSLLVPSVAWMSVAQLLMLAFSAYTIILSAMRLSVRHALPAWVGWLFGVAFVLAFCAEFCTSLTFTMTAAVLGAASIGRLLAVDWSAPPRRAAWGVLGSFALLLCAYALRETSMLPALAFWLGAALCLRLVERAPLRPLLCGVALCAVAMLLMVGARQLETRVSGEQDYLRWQRSNINAIDYGGLAAADAETLKSAGWTESTRQLALNWCFLDESMSAEAFESIPPAMQNRTVPAAIGQLLACLRRSRGVTCALAALVGLCGLSFGLSLCQQKKERLWPALASLCCAGGAVALLMALGYLGRLPPRAAYSVLLPALALALWLALRGCVKTAEAAQAPGTAALSPALARCARARRVASFLCALCCMTGLALCARVSAQNVYNPSPKQTQSAHARLERYALAHPDELLIGDNAFGMDRSLFPDWSAGKPNNLLLGWGGWNNHSPGYRAAFARFGYAHDHFKMADFLDSPLRLVVREGAQPVEAFMDCLAEQSSGVVTAEICYEGEGFRVYRFVS